MAAASIRPVTALEMAVLEQNAVALGVSVDVLMENAGRAVAEEATRHLPSAPARVAILAGPGNNGGDGTCAAYYLAQWGHSPEVWMVRPASEIRSAAARRCFSRIDRRLPIRFHPPDPAELRSFPLAIDALLGSGQTGELRSPYRESVQALGDAAVPTLSVDVPTGVGTGLSVHPRWTVALTAPKVGTSSGTAGEVTVREIGIPREASDQTGPGEFLYYPTGSARGARGRSARVLIIGGGPYAGAPALAALAALRSGAERATVAAPRPAADRIQRLSANLVVLDLGERILRADDVSTITGFLERAPVRAVVLGMGLGTDAETLDATHRLVGVIARRVPLVVDADALSSIASPASERVGGDAAPIVATPNAGEFQRYFGATADGSVADRLERATRLAAERGVVVLAKGAADLLSDGERGVVNLHHHPASTVSGVGDVLAGVTGSLLAQGVSAWGAVRLASYWVGEAGIRAAATKGFGLLATDVLDELPGALVDGVRRVRETG